MGSLYIGDVEVIGGGGGGGGGKYVDALVVGGGGGGGSAGGGGGGGGFIECMKYPVNSTSYSITIGCGGAGGSTSVQNNGGDSCFDNLIAYGGGAGGSSGSSGCLKGCNGGNGGGNGSVTSYYCDIGRNKPGLALNFGGHPGGASGYSGGGGAGQDGGILFYGEANCCSTKITGYGGNGAYSNISGQGCFYSGGGAGCNALGGTGGGGDWNSAATYYGGGGGASNCYKNIGCSGYQGIVILRYKTDGSCGITCATGGCKYTCGDYTIHCFTSSDTFCITG